MFPKKSSKPPSHIGSLIGVGTTVTGDIRFAGGLRVDGEIKGAVSAAAAQDGILVVGEQGRIEGGFQVSRAMINGTVIGPTISSDFLELQSQARIAGDIQYNTVEMHRGAVVHGQLVHHGSADPGLPEREPFPGTPSQII